MQIKEVKNYFKHWSGNKTDRKSKMKFLNMLQGKAYVSALKNKKMFAAGKMRTPKNLNKMLCIADDMFFVKA